MTRSFYVLSFVFCITLASFSQSGCEVRGLGGNWVSGPAMLGNPPTVTTNVATRSEYKIYCSSNNTWYPTGDNPWTNGGGDVTFTLTSHPKALAVEANMNFNLCAPGAFSGWNNSNPMTQNGNQWCVTVPNAGTYEWKPTRCSSWDAWELSNGRRNVSPPNWSITTTTSNQSVCINYDPTTGEVGIGYLPVIWADFEVFKWGKHHVIRWRTGSEINNQYFEVLHSYDGTNYQSIGMVDGAGTKYTESRYEFIHENPGSKLCFYKIRQVDYDGKNSYSEPRFLKNEEKEITILPNPGYGTFVINGMEELDFSVEVHNQSGQKINVIHSLASPYVDLSHLSSGIYYLNIISNESSYRVKWLKY